MIEQGADPNKLGYPDHLLVFASCPERSSEIFGFFLNAGADPNCAEGVLAPLCGVFQQMTKSRTYNEIENSMIKAAILLWGGARPGEKVFFEQTPLDLLEGITPHLVARVLAIVLAVPKIKARKMMPYVKIVSGYMAADSVNIVMSYSNIPWEEGYWNEINAAIPYWLETLRQVCVAGPEAFNRIAAMEK